MKEVGRGGGRKREEGVKELTLRDGWGDALELEGKGYGEKARWLKNVVLVFAIKLSRRSFSLKVDSPRLNMI